MLAAGDLTHAQFKTLIENHLAELSQNKKQKPVLQEVNKANSLTLYEFLFEQHCITDRHKFKFDSSTVYETNQMNEINYSIDEVK